MRPVRYNVVSTLDGYIAGPNGEYDWIPDDPTVDFEAIFRKIDTVLLGRRTYEAAQSGPPFGRRCASTSSRGPFAPRTIRRSRW
jgi:dihydrofolate reductase